MHDFDKLDEDEKMAVIERVKSSDRPRIGWRMMLYNGMGTWTFDTGLTMSI